MAVKKQYSVELSYFKLAVRTPVYNVKRNFWNT